MREEKALRPPGSSQGPRAQSELVLEGAESGVFKQGVFIGVR